MSGMSRMEIAVYPLGTGSPDVSAEVSRIFDVLERSGLEYRITVAGTVVEGSPDELFSLARALHEQLFSDAVRHVVTVMRIDDRRA